MVNATATIPLFMLYDVNFRDIDICFENHEIKVLSMKFMDDIINIRLNGTKDNLRKSIKALYKIINQRVKSKYSDSKVAEKIPEELKNYNKVLFNAESYEQHYDILAHQYISECKESGIQPHPEVLE